MYEYRCKKGHTFEVLQKITDEPVESCQHGRCRQPAERVLNAPAIRLRGKGFHNTDYPSTGRRRAAAAAS